MSCSESTATSGRLLTTGPPSSGCSGDATDRSARAEVMLPGRRRSDRAEARGGLQTPTNLRLCLLSLRLAVQPGVPLAAAAAVSRLSSRDGAEGSQVSPPQRGASLSLSVRQKPAHLNRMKRLPALSERQDAAFPTRFGPRGSKDEAVHVELLQGNERIFQGFRTAVSLREPRSPDAVHFRNGRRRPQGFQCAGAGKMATREFSRRPEPAAFLRSYCCFFLF